jgi:outer membrane protein OmpA-like peptidoglycan-associated protein
MKPSNVGAVIQGERRSTRPLVPMVWIVLLILLGCGRKEAQVSPGGTEVNPQWAKSVPSTQVSWEYAGMPVPEPSKKPLYRLREFNFPTQSSIELNREGKAVLREISVILKDKPATRVLVVGFADSVQEKSRGERLAGSRAKVATDELVRLGVAADRVESGSFGSSMAAAPAGKSLAQEADRKVEIWVLEE